jgi:hypothetical protein
MSCGSRPASATAPSRHPERTEARRLAGSTWSVSRRWSERKNPSSTVALKVSGSEIAQPHPNALDPKAARAKRWYRAGTRPSRPATPRPSSATGASCTGRGARAAHRPSLAAAFCPARASPAETQQTLSPAPERRVGVLEPVPKGISNACSYPSISQLPRRFTAHKASSATAPPEARPAMPQLSQKRTPLALTPLAKG